MSTTYLLDASGLCKRYFINEIGADIINDLFNDATSIRYLLNLTIPEILNAFYRVHREGHLTEAERDALISAFRACPERSEGMTSQPAPCWSTVCATIIYSMPNRLSARYKQ